LLLDAAQSAMLMLEAKMLHDDEQTTGGKAVAARLAAAFPWLLDNPEFSVWNHADWIKLRRKIVHLLPVDVLKILPYVLFDLIFTHTGHYIESEDAEFVIMFLDDRSEDMLLVCPTIFQLRAGRFDLFNKEQSSAVHMWLLLAKTWDDFPDWQDHLDAAIKYWEAKAAD